MACSQFFAFYIIKSLQTTSGIYSQERFPALPYGHTWTCILKIPDTPTQAIQTGQREKVPYLRWKLDFVFYVL